MHALTYFVAATEIRAEPEMIGLSVLVLATVVRTLAVQPDGHPGDAPVNCPVGEVTIIVPPEIGAIAVSRGGREIGAKVRRGQLVVSPARHAVSAVVEFRGTSGLKLRIRLQAVASGAGSEVRLQVVAGETRPQVARSTGGPLPTPSPGRSARPSSAPSAQVERTPTATPPPSLAPAAAEAIPSGPSPMPSPSVEVPSSSPPAVLPPAVDAIDLRDLQFARSVRIGRREGLPGQRQVELEEARQGERNVWLRFRVVGGARLKVQKVEWEHGPIASHTEEMRGKDLQVVVQLARAKVSKKTRVKLRLSDGADYSFALSSPWFSTFLRALFE